MTNIDYSVDGAIGTVTINRPEKRNAMTYAMLGEFHAAIQQASTDDSRVVIVTGSGGSFCAGTDLSDLSGRDTGDRGRTASGAEALVWPLTQLPKPVIGAIDGPAVGMGAEFTSQCDVRICTGRARFAWNFVHRGLVPDTGAGTWLLPKLIGLTAAMKLVFSGEFLGAEDALKLGYVTAVVEPDELPTAARALAETFLKGSPFAQRLAKKLFYDGLNLDRDTHIRSSGQALQQCFGSEDHKEGVASFLERREANFTGR